MKSNKNEENFSITDTISVAETKGDQEFEYVTADPPDGGWGWVIVFSSFMIHVITDGITCTAGIFYTEFLKYFKESKGVTSWVISIMQCTTLCVGPIASKLTNKYDCRTVTIAGALLATFGFTISTMVPDVIYLFFTLGLCVGAGFGFMFLPAIVIVSTYFEKKRAFATGIAVCGSGIGTLVMVPITEGLVGEFGWRGAMLILAGITLNCCVFGALFRPLTKVYIKSTANKIFTIDKIPKIFLNDSWQGSLSSDLVGTTGSRTSIAIPENIMNNCIPVIVVEEYFETPVDESHISENQNENIQVDFELSSTIDHNNSSDNQTKEVEECPKRFAHESHALENQSENIQIDLKSSPTIDHNNSSLNQEEKVKEYYGAPTPESNTLETQYENTQIDFKLSPTIDRINLIGNQTKIVKDKKCMDSHGEVQTPENLKPQLTTITSQEYLTCSTLDQATLKPQASSKFSRSSSKRKNCTNHRNVIQNQNNLTLRKSITAFEIFGRRKSSVFYGNAIRRQSNSKLRGSITSTKSLSRKKRSDFYGNVIQKQGNSKRRGSITSTKSLSTIKSNVFYDNVIQRQDNSKHRGSITSIESSSTTKSNSVYGNVLPSSKNLKHRGSITSNVSFSSIKSNVFYGNVLQIQDNLKPQTSVTAYAPMSRRNTMLYSSLAPHLSKKRSNSNISSSMIASKPPQATERSTFFTSMCFYPQKIKNAIIMITDITLFTDTALMIFVLSNFFTDIGFNVPFVYTMDRAISMGVADENHASYLLSVIGIANTVGGVIFGYLSDQPYINRLWLYNGSLVFCGLATAFSSFCNTYPLMILYAILFGSTSGANEGLTSVILVDLLGLEKLAAAFGLLLVIESFACLIGPPITGWLFDCTGSYDPGFYLSGAMIALSGFILFFLPCAQRRIQRKKDEQKENEQKENEQKDNTQPHVDVISTAIEGSYI